MAAPRTTTRYVHGLYEPFGYPSPGPVHSFTPGSDLKCDLRVTSQAVGGSVRFTASIVLFDRAPAPLALRPRPGACCSVADATEM